MIDPGVKVDAGYRVYNSGSEGDVWVHDAKGAPFQLSLIHIWPGPQKP